MLRVRVQIDGLDFQRHSTTIVGEIEEPADAATRPGAGCDYVAGMTDSSAARIFKTLFSPDLSSINDR